MRNSTRIALMCLLITVCCSMITFGICMAFLCNKWAKGKTAQEYAYDVIQELDEKYGIDSDDAELNLISCHYNQSAKTFTYDIECVLINSDYVENVGNIDIYSGNRKIITIYMVFDSKTDFWSRIYRNIRDSEFEYKFVTMLDCDVMMEVKE